MTANKFTPVEINGEFRFAWVKKWGFWRVIWMGMVGFFGYTAYIQDKKTGDFYSYGSKFPLQIIMKEGYHHKLIGRVFLFNIYQYIKLPLCLN